MFSGIQEETVMAYFKVL